MHNFSYFDFCLSFLTLTLLEIILNSDNIIFIITACSRLPQSQQALARKTGVIMAAALRIIFLSVLFFATTFATPLFYIGKLAIAINNIVFILGGVFLMINPALEMRQLRLIQKSTQPRKNFSKFSAVIIQILLVDMVFSIDNVMTAIGMTKLYVAMISAIVIAMLFMVIASNTLSDWAHRYPKLQVISLSYLMLIGAILVARGLGHDISSAYIYVPLAFVIFTQGMLAYTRY